MLGIFLAVATLTHGCVCILEFGKHVMFESIVVAANGRRKTGLICPTEDVVGVLFIEVGVQSTFKTSFWN